MLFPLVSYFLMRFELKVIQSTKDWERETGAAMRQATPTSQQMAFLCRQVDRLILGAK